MCYLPINSILIYKAEDLYLINYRNMSLLNVLPKVFEIKMYNNVSLMLIL